MMKNEMISEITYLFLVELWSSQLQDSVRRLARCILALILTHFEYEVTETEQSNEQAFARMVVGNNNRQIPT